ncbi:MAG: DUF1501 domain-containing protein [Chloroflexota bacterium]
MAHLITRRRFLETGATLISTGWAVPSFIAATASLLDPENPLRPKPVEASTPNGRILVLLQLGGGNDGINTVIPYGDARYYDATVRPDLAIPANQVLQLSSYVGLHPNLSRLKTRWDRGQVGVVQGVGYPNATRSHFRGTDIWESAVPTRFEASGWVGRYIEQRIASCSCSLDNLEAITAGSSTSAGTFWTEMALVPAVASISSFRYTSVNTSTSPTNTQRTSEIATLRTALAQTDGHAEAEFLRKSIRTALDDSDIVAAAATKYTPIGNYGTSGLGNSLKMIAQLIGSNSTNTAVYYCSLGGFDTHTGQLTSHGNLMNTLDQTVDAFFADIENIGKANQVTLMTFSEFGRRLAQNGTGTAAGTDHGLAAPMFVIGGNVAGGLYSTYPSLQASALSGGDIQRTVDFRQVYATILEDWLGVPSSGILESAYTKLPFFRPPPNPSAPSRTGAAVGGTPDQMPGRIAVPGPTPTGPVNQKPPSRH